MTVGEFIKAFHERGFGFLLMLFTLPVAIPIPKPPGVPTLLSLPITLICVQLVYGADAPWIPHRLRDKHLSPKLVRKTIQWFLPRVRSLEKYLKPRLLMIDEVWLTRAVGLFGLAMCFSIFLPLPGSDIIPAICLLLASAALIVRDGIAVLLFSCIGLTYTTLLFIFGAKAAHALLALVG